MKKLYVKPEMEVQEFAPEDTIMSDVFGSGAWCDGYSSTECNGGDSEYVIMGTGCIIVSEDEVCSLVSSAP